MTVVKDSAQEREGLARRIVRGLDLYQRSLERGSEIVRLKEDLYRVPSATDEDTSYDVSIEAGSEHCACRDFEIRRLGGPCKHVYAALVADAKRTLEIERRRARMYETRDELKAHEGRAGLKARIDAFAAARERYHAALAWKPGVV